MVSVSSWGQHFCVHFLQDLQPVLSKDLNGHQLKVVLVVQTSSVHPHPAALSFQVQRRLIPVSPWQWDQAMRPALDNELKTVLTGVSFKPKGERTRLFPKLQRLNKSFMFHISGGPYPIGCLFFSKLYFVLGCSRWTRLGQFQMDSKGAWPYIYMYPISLKLPSHPGCHTTLSRITCVYSRSLLVIPFKYKSMYMPVLLNTVLLELIYILTLSNNRVENLLTETIWLWKPKIFTI